MPLVVIRRGATLGLALVLLVAGSALADTLTADGDALTTGNQTSIHLGEVAPGSTHTLDVGFALGCKGSGHLTAGATIAINADGGTSVPDDGALTVTDGSVAVPTDWPTAGTFCTGNESAPVVVPVQLDLTAPSVAGIGKTFVVFFGLSGGEAVTNAVAFSVSMDVVAPDPVDTMNPVLGNLPADITATTSDSSAVVTYATPGATDDIDPSPVVACVPPSGSAFPLGVTTVTCTATDATGNSASGTFSVTVEHVTALTGTWGRPLADGVPALVGHAGRTVPLKLDIRAGSAAQGPSDISAPTLVVERLDGCAADAATTSSLAGGTFAWTNGGWQLNLDTSGLGGCVRVSARVAGVAVAAAIIRLEPDAVAARRKR